MLVPNYFIHSILHCTELRALSVGISVDHTVYHTDQYLTYMIVFIVPDAFHQNRSYNNCNRSTNTCDFPLQYHTAAANNKMRYANRPQQDCSCGYSNYTYSDPTDESYDRTINVNTISIPTRYKNHRYEDIYPIKAHQVYEEIYPSSAKQKEGDEIINPPDIANISASYSKLENRDIYDPEFIRKQPDILQSSYYGNRNASSLSTDSTAINYRSTHNSSSQTQNSAYADELKRKSYSLPKSFQRNDKMRSEFKSPDK